MCSYFLTFRMPFLKINIGSFILFPDNPVKSNFLSPEEKLVAVEVRA
jgi:hypothetical protein